MAFEPRDARAARDEKRAAHKIAQEASARALPALDRWVAREEKAFLAGSARAPARMRTHTPPATLSSATYHFAAGAPRDRANQERARRERARTGVMLYYLATDRACEPERSALYSAMIFDEPGARALFEMLREEQRRVLIERVRRGDEKPTDAPAPTRRGLTATVGERIRAKAGLR